MNTFKVIYILPDFCIFNSDTFMHFWDSWEGNSGSTFYTSNFVLFLANRLKLFFTKGYSTTKTIAKIGNKFISESTDWKATRYQQFISLPLYCIPQGFTLLPSYLRSVNSAWPRIIVQKAFCLNWKHEEMDSPPFS